MRYAGKVLVSGLLLVTQVQAFSPVASPLALKFGSGFVRSNSWDLRECDDLFRRRCAGNKCNGLVCASAMSRGNPCSESVFEINKKKVSSALWGLTLAVSVFTNLNFAWAQSEPKLPETALATPSQGKDAEHTFLDEVLTTVEDHFLDLNNPKGVAESSRTKTFNGISWAEVRKQLDAEDLRSREDTYAKVRQLLPKLGDKYTRFMPPSEFAKLSKYDITGVGVLMIEKEGSIYLAAPPLGGSTGAEAGLQKGDRVLAIDGVTMDKKTPFDATERLGGQAGTKVQLRLQRGGGAPFDVTLERRISVRNPVRTHVVTAKDGRLVGYMRMSEFNAGSRKGVAEAVNELDDIGVSDIVLDLRGNPGGVLEGSLQIAGLFLTDPPPAPAAASPAAAAPPAAAATAADFTASVAPRATLVSSASPTASVATPAAAGGSSAASPRGETAAGKRTLVYVMDRNGREEPVWLPARRGGPAGGALDGSTPLIILMNKRSASASEVLAGALRDNCRAVVVGSSPSFGKGLIQGAFPLSDGSGVVVTVAKYLTPKHLEIQGVGVVPDLSADVGPGRAAIRSGRLDLAAAERRLAACVPPPPDAGDASGEETRSGTDRTLERLNGPRDAGPAAGGKESSLFSLRAADAAPVP